MGQIQEVVVPYRPRAAFLPFHARTAREAVLVCHRRAGKTVALCNDLQKRCLQNTRRNPPPRYAWFYPTRVRAKDIAWPYLKYFSDPIPGRRVIESELAIEYPNGGRVTLYGADNSRGVGLYLDGAAYDERDEIPRQTIVDVTPALSDYKGWSVHAGMLKGRYNLWRYYQDAVGNPERFTMLLRASESGIIDKEELRLLRERMGEAAYEMQLECNANAAIANAIYGKQMDDMRKENRITRLAASPDVSFDAFFDIGHSLNGDDWTCWFIQMSGRDVLLQGYYARTGEMPAHYARVLLDMQDTLGCPLGTVYLPHDGARQDRQGRTAKDDLEAAGIKRIKVVPRTPNLWDSINHCRALMPRMFINQGNCSEPWMLGEIEMPSGIDCLDFYTKKEEAQTGLIQDVPVHNQFSHGADALRTFAEAHRLGMVEGTSFTARETRLKPVKVLRGPSPSSYPVRSRSQWNGKVLR